MKNQLRKQAIANRNGLSPSLRKFYGKQIAKRIFSSSVYEKAGWIFTYVSFGSEVDTKQILMQAWKDGKQVAVPITKKNGFMYFVEIHKMKELFTNPYGLLEPKKEKQWEVIPSGNDLFLIPALAFDLNKNRLGYGGGYYDRYLEKHHCFYKIGLSYEMQIWKEDLPKEKHDFILDCIVTEKRWIGGKSCECINTNGTKSKESICLSGNASHRREKQSPAS